MKLAENVKPLGLLFLAIPFMAMIFMIATNHYKENAYQEYRIAIDVGTITAAERVPKADKLLKLAIDIGEPTPRTLVSGIAQHYASVQLTGQQVVLVANLEPRKMRGVESQGMVLMAEDTQGKLVFVQPKDVIGSGAEVR